MFCAAYELPTRVEQRRALAPLVNRGFVRLALIPGMFTLFFFIEPHYGNGIGIAMLAAFAIVAAIFLTLHKLFAL